MAKTRRNNNTRRKYSRRGKYVKRKYSKKNKYSKKKYRKSKRKQHNNRKRNMKGGLVTLKDFENDKQIFVLREDDETETPEGSLVIKDNDMVIGSDSGWLDYGDFSAENMKGWIMTGLNKAGHTPRIDSPDSIQLYKGGKSIGDLFTGDEEEDAENDITIYVKLPPRDTPLPAAEAAPEAAAAPAAVAEEAGLTRTISPLKDPVSETQTEKLASLNMPADIKTGGITSGELQLEKLKQIKEKAEEIYLGEFLGTALIKLYNSGRYDITLDELKSIYKIYIKDANVNETNQYGDTMLGTAVYYREYDIIRFLVNIPGINLNDDYSIRNPLFLAIDNLDYAMIDFLLSLNASDHIIDVNVKNEKEETPLFALYEQMKLNYEKMKLNVGEVDNIIEMFKKLIDMGADKGAENFMGYTLLQQAIYDQKWEKKKYLDKLITYLETLE